MKAEWRSVLRDSGVQCVMIYGALMMLKWLVDNWDIHQQVNITPYPNMNSHYIFDLK